MEHLPLDKRLYLIKCADRSATAAALEEVAAMTGMAIVAVDRTTWRREAFRERAAHCALFLMNGGSMSEDDWAEACIAELPPHVAVVIASRDISVGRAVRLMRAGAQDIVNGRGDRDQLCSSIRAALADADRRYRIKLRLDELLGRYDQLTNRERQICELIVSGVSNRHAATQLKISDRTVEVHRANVFRKLEVESVIETVAVLCELEKCRRLIGTRRHDADAFGIAMDAPQHDP